MKRLAPARPANPVRAREVGEIMALDFSYHTTADGIKLMVLNIIDEASKFHVAKIVRQDKVKTHTELGNCDADTLIECLQEYTRYIKPPKVIHCDDEGFFRVTNSNSGAASEQFILDLALAKLIGKMALSKGTLEHSDTLRQSFFSMIFTQTWIRNMF